MSFSEDSRTLTLLPQSLDSELTFTAVAEAYLSDGLSSIESKFLVTFLPVEKSEEVFEVEMLNKAPYFLSAIENKYVRFKKAQNASLFLESIVLG